MSSEEQDDDTIYEVVVNHEEQYSIWPEYKGDPPLGWKKVGKNGQKDECLAYIKEVWTDMRPLSLRRQMDGEGSSDDSAGSSTVPGSEESAPDHETPTE